MKFNPDLNKQGNEDIFYRKSISNNLPRPPINFNEKTITKCPHQKHLGITLHTNRNPENSYASIDKSWKGSTW